MSPLQKNHTSSDCFLCQKTIHRVDGNMPQNNLQYETEPARRTSYRKVLLKFHINSCDRNMSYTRLPGLDAHY